MPEMSCDELRGSLSDYYYYDDDNNRFNDQNNSSASRFLVVHFFGVHCTTAT